MEAITRYFVGSITHDDMVELCARTDGTFEGYEPVIDEEFVKYTDHLARIAMMREALKPYLMHTEECASENNDQHVGALPCNCGLDADLKAAMEET
jgi:hypothetical protein